MNVHIIFQNIILIQRFYNNYSRINNLFDDEKRTDIYDQVYDIPMHENK